MTVDLGSIGLGDGGCIDEPWALGQAAIAAGAKELLIPAGNFTTATGSLPYGDGTDTQQASKAFHGVRIKTGADGGYGTGYAAGGLPSCRIHYTGPQDDAVSVMRVNGPVTGVEMDGGLFLDAAGNAGQGVEILHTMGCKWEFHVERPRQRFGTLRARDVVYTGINSTPWGMAENELYLTSDAPALPSTCGWWLGGGHMTNAGFCRNRGFVAGIYGGAAGSWGVALDYADNNDELYGYTTSYAHPLLGKGKVYVVREDGFNPGLFPLENPMPGAFIGGVGYIKPDGSPAPTGGGRMLLPWLKTADWPHVPRDPRVLGWTCHGEMFGGWRGALSAKSGRSHPGYGLTGAQRFYPLECPPDVGVTSDYMLTTIGPQCRVRRFGVRLDGTPTDGSRTFHLRVNCARHPQFSVTFGPTDTGVKRAIVPEGVWFGEGTLFSVESEVSGAPVNSNAAWWIEYYPGEGN